MASWHRQPATAIIMCCLEKASTKHLHELHPCFLLQWFIFILWSNWIKLSHSVCHVWGWWWPFSWAFFVFLTERTLPNFGKEKHLTDHRNVSKLNLRTVTELNQPGMAPKHKSKSGQIKTNGICKKKIALFSC